MVFKYVFLHDNVGASEKNQVYLFISFNVWQLCADRSLDVLAWFLLIQTHTSDYQLPLPFVNIIGGWSTCLLMLVISLLLLLMNALYKCHRKRSTAESSILVGYSGYALCVGHSSLLTSIEYNEPRSHWLFHIVSLLLTYHYYRPT